MIQRVQTIFLLLASFAMISFLILPVWMKMEPVTGEAYKVYSTHLFHQSDPASGGEMIFLPWAYSGAVALITVLIAWIEIFKYNNRLTQVKLGTLNSLLIAGALVWMVYLIYDVQDEILPKVLGEYQVGLFMPAIALIFNALANRFIRKDEKLVRSVDRIR